jgi:methionyl-tRNA synthetase
VSTHEEIPDPIDAGWCPHCGTDSTNGHYCDDCVLDIEHEQSEDRRLRAEGVR